VRLDAVITILLERCAPPGIALNSLAATEASDTNSIAVKAEKARQEARALDAFTKLPKEDRRALLLGQGYYFDQTADGRVPIGSFLSAAAQQAFVQVDKTFDQIGAYPGPKIMVFDRTRTSIGQDLQSKPNGWFSAIATKDRIYMSPTIVRAALIACTAETRIRPSYLAQLRQIQAMVRTRRTAPGDAMPTISAARREYTKATNCIADQLTFLIAHEVAHQRLSSLEYEERADCVGSAIARHLRRPVPGVFGEVIFDLAGTSDEDLLGAAAPSLKELTCRRSLPWVSLDRQEVSDLKTAIEVCRSSALVCDNR